MSYCLNPDCQKPQNPEINKFCQHCGTKLLLGSRYRALKPIAQGGFGRTLLAVDEYKPSKPRCVIKQFLPQAQGTNSAEKAAALFQQEAVRLDELGKHRQIPELLAYFTQDLRQYLVQEFIDGPNLAQELAEEGAFNEKQIWQMLDDLLPVLQFVHSHQVIHRDIKPENIIRRRGDNQLVLVDFGAAKFATGTSLAKTGTVIGSAGYVAPEQTVGKAIFASDIYSLGVTCIHLLTQMHPFELFDISENNWVWQQYLTISVSDRLCQILDKMVQVAIKLRYHSAEEIIKDLNSQPHGAARTAKPVTPAKPAKRTPPVAPVVITTQNWKCVHTLSGHTGMLAGVRSVAISPDGQTLASGSDDYTIKLWNLTTGKEIRTLSRHSNFVRSVTFSPDGSILASGSDDKNINLWNLTNQQEIRTLLIHSNIVTTVAVSPDGDIIASDSYDKTIKLWNWKTGQEIRTLSGHSDHVLSVAFSPDGQTLASGSCDSTIKVWNLNTGEEVFTLSATPGNINSVCFSFDGKTIASGDSFNKVKLWDLNSRELRHNFTGRFGWLHNGVNSVAIATQGNILASGSGDSSIKIWHLETGELLSTLIEHTKGVLSVAFSPDGETLVSGSNDKTIKIWQRN